MRIAVWFIGAFAIHFVLTNLLNCSGKNEGDVLLAVRDVSMTLDIIGILIAYGIGRLMDKL